MDVLSLINDVVNDVSVTDTKQEEPHTHTVRYTIKRDVGVDIETLRKLIHSGYPLTSVTPVLSRPMPSYTFAEFRQPTPESPLTATEMMDRIRVFRNATGMDRDKLLALGLEMIREDNFRSAFVFEPEPEPHQEMWMRDHPTVVRW